MMSSILFTRLPRRIPYFVVLLLVGLVFQLKAQQDAPNQHYWVTPALINPAVIGIDGTKKAEISLSVLDYWVMVPGAPKVIDAVVALPIHKRLSIGAFFRQEESFLIQETQGKFAMYYGIPFNTVTRLQFGLGLGFFNSRIDFGNATVQEAGDDLVLAGPQNQAAFHFTMSAAFSWKRFRAGLHLPFFLTGQNNQVGSFRYGVDRGTQP